MDHNSIYPFTGQMGTGFKDQKGREIMTCFTCRGNLEERLTTFTIDIDGRVYVIKSVPSHVCTQCGAVSYPDAVMARIEQMIESMKNSCTEFSVATYAA